MGMSASNAVAQVQNQTILNASTTCSVSNIINNVVNCPEITLDHCDHFHSICGITGTSTVGCTAGQGADAAQQAVANATAKAKAALGLAFSNSNTLTTQGLTTTLTANCTESQTVDQVVNSLPVYCMDSNDASITTLLDCDIPTRCYLAQSASAIQTAAAAALSDAQGWDPISSLLGPISQAMKDAILAVIVIAVIVVFAIVGLVTLKLLMGRRKAPTPAAPAAPPQQFSRGSMPPPYYGGYGY